MNSNVPMFTQAIKNALTQITDTDAQNDKIVYTGGAQGSVIEMLSLTMDDDQQSNTIQLSIKKGSNIYPLGQITINAVAGFGSNPAINLLRNAQLSGLSYDAFGNKILYLEAGNSLVVRAINTVTSGKFITLVGSAGDF